MFFWSLICLAVALIAALFGFGGLAIDAAGLAQIIFVIALLLFAASAIASILRHS